MIKKYIPYIFVGIMTVVSLAPAFAFADSTVSVDMQTKIELIIKQIKSLQEQLHVLTTTSVSATSSMPMMHGGDDMDHEVVNASSTLVCPRIRRDIGMGSRGDDVKQLQVMLAESQIYSGGATGYFGPQTKKAMMNFQNKFGISSGAGAVGSATREFLDNGCMPPRGVSMDKNKEDEKGSPMMIHPMVLGTVTANTGSAITLKLANGSMQNVLVNASTTVLVFVSTTTPPTTGSISSIVVGQSVIVEGRRLSDGIFTALAIRIGFPTPQPMMMHGLRREFDKNIQ